MLRAFRLMRFLCLSLLLASLISILPNAGAASRAGNATQSIAQSRTRPLPVERSHAFINYRIEGAVSCREATAEEAGALKRRGAAPVHEISELRSGERTLAAESTGLHIVLRGTDQLENYPTAKAAFLKAAAEWESLIATPITVVIDVDFGPTWFGERYEANVLGQTDSQDLGESSIYGEVRSALGGLASGDYRAGLYGQLPQFMVPTDIGSTSYVLAPSALWRALGFISALADPVAEENDLGDPPAVGFNSNFIYDFDPTNGVASNAIDFDAVAVHEVGHVLGFDSNTGSKELFPSSPIAVSIWDLFRFRPGASSDAFGSAQRILSSGGSQDFFNGSLELALSTGRPDGTGGDREQASHWKDDRFTGEYIGIMDPTLADGQRKTITSNDVAALGWFGFALADNQNTDGAPNISKVSFSGTKLVIKGSGFKGVIQVEINGQIVSSTLNVGVNDSGSKIKIKASPGALNLNAGANQLRVISDGLASNTVSIEL